MSASRQSSRTSSGIPLRFSDSVIEVRDFPKASSQILVREPVVPGEGEQRLSLFERAEVSALQVLDEGDLDQLRVVDIPDHRRDLPQPDLNGRLVASLPPLRSGTDPAAA